MARRIGSVGVETLVESDGNVRLGGIGVETIVEAAGNVRIGAAGVETIVEPSGNGRLVAVGVETIVLLPPTSTGPTFRHIGDRRRRRITTF